MATVNFQAPTDYSVEAADIDRRRKMAELLQQQAMEPIHQQPTPAGGFAVPISWTQGLAKAIQGYAGQRGIDRASEQQKALGERYNTERAAALSGALRAGQGAPAQPELPANEMDTVGTPAQAAVPGSQAAMMAQLIGSKFPDLQQAGLTQTLDSMKPRVVGHSLLTGTGALVGSDPTFAAQQEANRVDKGEQAAAARVEAERKQKAEQEFRSQQAQEALAGRQTLLQLGASLRPPRAEPAVQPLVAISDGQGGSTLVERKDAIGKVPAVTGSKLEAKEAGKSDVDKDVVKLKGLLDDLKTGGGITDTSKGAIPNIGSAIGASGVGQFFGGAVGTKNQSARNELLMIRPSLLRSIMSSTGMSAKQMDSNAELKLWLSTATDPTKDYQANLQALDNIARKYGSGGILEGGQTSSGRVSPAPSGIQDGATATGPNGQKIVFRGGQWVPQ